MNRHWSELEEQGYKLAQLVSPFFKMRSKKGKNCFSFSYRIPKIISSDNKIYTSSPELPSLEVSVEPFKQPRKGKSSVHLWEKMSATPDGKWQRTELDLLQHF